MKSLGDMTSAILAGGLGTRLRSVVGDRPKVLAEVASRPFLTYLLDRLAEAGIRRVVLCTGFWGDRVKAALGNAYRSLALVYSQEMSPLGTGGALRLALPLLESSTVLVMNGDSICEAGLRPFHDVHRLRGAQASLLLKEVEDVGRFGWVRVGEDGRVLGFVEKGKKEGRGWINAGVYLLNRTVLEEIPPHEMVSLERDILPTWIGRGLYGFRSEGRFIDIGTPESLASAGDFFTREKAV